MILDAQGRQIATGKRKQMLNARFDAAQTTTENSKQWSWADALSADSAANPAVRTTLRNRARYETANNSYLRGITNFICNDIIGGSIRLVVKTNEGGSASRSKYAKKNLMTRDEAWFIEGEFQDWLDATGALSKLRTMVAGETCDGESFAMLGTNRRLETQVKLDFSPFETEMCQAAYIGGDERNEVDGITYDQWGNPNTYRILKEHPGSNNSFYYNDANEYSYKNIIHYYKVDRAGQRRGIPRITASLPLFAQLRRFTLSVLAAAETAADFAAILHTNSAYEEGTATAAPFDIVDIERRMMQVLPEGWDMRQFKAEQPVSTYAEFVRTLLREINRPLDVPMNVALGDSSGYNFASGKLDWQIWEKARSVRRVEIVQQVIDPLFNAWKTEAILIEGYFPQSLRNVSVDWAHTYLFTGDKHQDPQKEAKAQETRLANKTTTLASEYGAEGKDWEEQLVQIAREKAKKLELGLVDDDLADDPADEEADEEEAEDSELVMSRDEHGRLLSVRGF